MLNKQLAAMQANMRGIDATKMADLRAKFRGAVAASGAFGIEQLKAVSATEAFTKSLQKQDMTFGDAIKNRRMFNNVLAEQYRIQKMLAVQWSTSGSGRMTADVIMPRGLDASLQKVNESWRENAKVLATAKRGSVEFSNAADMMRMRLGLLNQVVASGADNMVKWGKNTQWAGRQLMVGFTVPLIAFGALTGKIAYDVDKQLTRIAKVYDTTATTMVGKQQELDALRRQSSQNAIEVARRYGSEITKTLEVEAELAAAGMRGAELLRSTNEVQRIATLGELDHQKAVTMSIALQKAFGLTVEQTSEKMNFMNAIENATVLSIQDFAEATPRAASAMSQLGVSVEEMGVLLVAMKENGVDAAQGANALRSATARMLNPTKESVKALKGFGINIVEITKQTGGNLFKILEVLGSEFERVGLTALEQRQAIAELFGTYQFNRLNATMAGVATKTGQVGRAMDVIGQGAEKNAAIAANELNKITESLSGRFNIAVQTIKAELSTMGEPFLDAGAKILNFLSKIIGGINELPHGVKAFAAGVAILAAVMGPIIMLTGLLGNGIGMLIKFGNWLPGLTNKFRAVTTEQQAQKLLSESTTKMWQNQGMAAKMLAAEITNLTMAIGRQNQAMQSAAALAAGTALPRGPRSENIGGFYQASTGTLTRVQPGGGSKGVSRNDPAYRKYSLAAAAAAEDEAWAMHKSKDRMSAAGEKWDRTSQRMVAIEGSSKRTAGHWGNIAKNAGYMGIAATGMMAMTGQADKLDNKFMNIALTAALIGPMVAGSLGKALKSTALRSAASKALGPLTGSAAAQGMKKLIGKGGVGGLTSGFQALSKVAMRFAGPAGIIGGAAVLAFIKVRGEMAKAKKAQEDINNSAKDWADILGFVYSEQAKINGQQGKNNSLLEDRRNKLQKSNPALVEELQRLKEAGREQALYNMAIDEGIKARLHGADAAQAQQAVELALFAAGFKRSEIAEMSFVTQRVNWENMSAVITETQESFKRQWEVSAKNAAGQGKWEGFGRIFTGRNELNVTTKTKIKGMAEDFFNVWKGLEQKPRAEYFEAFKNSIVNEQGKAFDAIGGAQKKNMARMGITNSYELLTRLQEDLANRTRMAASGQMPAGPDLAGRLGLTDDDISRIQMAAKAEEQFARVLAQANGVTGAALNGIRTLADVTQHLDMEVTQATKPIKTIKDAHGAWAEEMDGVGKRFATMSEKEKLAILNKHRLAAGLDAAIHSGQGFGDVMDSDGKVLKGVAAAARGAASGIEEVSNAMDKARVDAIKGAMGSAWGTIMDSAMEQYESQSQAQMDQLDKDADNLSDRQEREQDRFQNRWDAIYKRFDARWDKRMEKERAGEEFRKQMFEAEKARIERLNAMENASIDFNSALNRGELDEAAKIQNNAQAQVETWSAEDAEEMASKSSEARINALEKTREKEREALDKQKEDEEKALERQHKAQQERIESARKAAEKISEINRKALERDLERAREFIPKNAKEVRKYTQELERIYGEHGLKLDTTSAQWGDMVAGAIRTSVAAAQEQLSQEGKWASIADTAAKDAAAAFGMTIDQFMKWAETGKVPKGVKAPSEADLTTAQRGAMNKQNANVASFHTGGIIGQGGGSRTGYAGSQMPGEISINALRGEAVLNRQATRQLGKDGIESLNSGKGIGGFGMAGMLGAGIAGMVRSAIRNTVNFQAIRKIKELSGISGPSFSAARPGAFAGVEFDAAQLANASTIMNVGRSMGASPRDLQIALMTAMQESMLRNVNYGDRDSLGLFQQRPSMGWGTPAQVMNPEYASRQFFKSLLAIEGRGSMSLAQAAQAVQRSAFPDAYAKWEAQAAAIMQGSALTGQGEGTWGRPVSPMVINRGFTAHNRQGVDLGGTPGQGIYSVGNGRVITSAALRGVNPYDNDGYRSYGEYVIVDHGGMTSLYAHMLQNSRRVRTGDSVTQGQLLGSLGSTGNSSGPHLHFESRVNGNMVDPAAIGIPGLAVGGKIKYDNTIANLHKKETVLTAPLSNQLERGIDKMDKGGYNGDVYQFNFDGATFSKDIDVEAAIENVLRKRDSRMGRQRKIS